MRPWKECRKILCVRLDNLGDVLMTTPAVRALKESLPAAELIAMVSPNCAPLVELIPAFDGSILYDAPWVKQTTLRENAVKDFEIIQNLRDARFDAAIIFTVFSQNPLPAAMMCYLAGIPRRLAYGHENPYQLLTDWIKDPDPSEGIRHEVRRQLDLVATIGATTADTHLSLEIPWLSKAGVINRLREKGITWNDPFVVMHPGATAPSRRYPLEKFIRAANAIGRRFECPIVWTGASGEQGLVEEIERGLETPGGSLIGRLDFAELCALISMAAVVVTNNSAPAHIAAATGTPVVDLYALTNPQHTPWQVSQRVLFHDVPCKFCFKSECPAGHHQCLQLVSYQEVVEAVEELMEERFHPVFQKN